MKPLWAAVATASERGRNGRAWTADHTLELDLAVPEETGGPGGGANPEQLFALGYAACFVNAMRSAARKQRREEAVDGATVTAHVDIGRDGEPSLAVRLDTGWRGNRRPRSRRSSRRPMSAARRGTRRAGKASPSGAGCQRGTSGIAPLPESSSPDCSAK